MRFFTARKSSSSSFTTPSQSSSVFSRTSSKAWSLLCSIVILNTFLALTAFAAPDRGFCGDCQTFANAISVCGGSFTPADIEIPTESEYVLQEQYAKCTCTAVMQAVLWTCGRCELLAGYKMKGVPPKKHQMTCMAWGTTLQAYNAPYTGVVAPGTQTDLTGPPPPQPPGSMTSNPAPPPTNLPSTKPTTPTPTGGNGNGNDNGGNKPSDTTNSASPSSSSDNSLNGDKNTSETSSGPNTAAIGISVGIIGVAFVAGIMTVVMMKRRRRRRMPLDLDSSPALANFVALEDKWEPKARPGSPPLPSVPIASATPVVGPRGGGRGGYGEGSVVGGYDAQYDGQYDQYYDHHGGYDAYGQGGQHGHGGHGQYRNQYDQYYDQGYQQENYQMHDYGYDQHAASQGPMQPSPQPHGGSIDPRKP
ncbi:hypothetical protein BGX33_003735 [Mortierella sp. NVP41]|nr:hypothetical protein BGX33_003735 [Mortierella sp. NVP41]